MILSPEEQIEEGQRMVELYIPKLEDLLDVELGEIPLKPWEDMGDVLAEVYLDMFRATEEDSWLKHAAWGLTRPAHEFIARVGKSVSMAQLTVLHSDAIFSYHSLASMVFQGPNPQEMTETTLARSLVHELAHAAGDEIADTSQLHPRGLRMAVEEGFAEYVSLNLFRDEYDIEFIGSFLEGVAFSHLMADEARHQKCMGLVGKITYASGYLFFEKVHNKGIDPRDVLRNPPETPKEVLNPQLYIERVKQE